MHQHPVGQRLRLGLSARPPVATASRRTARPAITGGPRVIATSRTVPRAGVSQVLGLEVPHVESTSSISSAKKQKLTLTTSKSPKSATNSRLGKKELQVSVNVAGRAECFIADRQLALKNFELFYKMRKGTATVEMVNRSAAGTHGWAKARLSVERTSPAKPVKVQPVKSLGKISQSTACRLQQAKEAATEVQEEQAIGLPPALPMEESAPCLTDFKPLEPISSAGPDVSVLVNSVGGETLEVHAHSGELVADLRRRIAKAWNKPLTQLALLHGTSVLHGMQRVGEALVCPMGETDNRVDEVIDGPRVEHVEISAFLSQEGGPVEELMDFDDAQGLAEYLPELYMGLKSQEAKVHIDPLYMGRQPHINLRMRAILVDWLDEVHLKYELRTVTLFLAVSILDRYLQANNVERKQLQLIGIVSLMIAAKFEDINPLGMKEVAYVCDDAYTVQDASAMEAKILTSLGFGLTFPTSAHFMDLYQRANRCDTKQCFLVQYLLELAFVEVEMIGEIPSEMAAAATLLSNSLLHREVCWPEAMASYTGYTEPMLENLVNKMRQSHASAPTSSLQVVFRKFSKDRFGGVSSTLPS